MMRVRRSEDLAERRKSAAPCAFAPLSSVRLPIKKLGKSQ